MPRSIPRPLLAVLVLLALIISPAAAAATPLHGQETTNPSGFLRVGHLAPEVGAVTVQLIPAGSDPEVVVEKAPYGAVTDYKTLAPGDYTLAMRPVDADEATPPLLSADVTIASGMAYTVLVTGEPAALVTSVVEDDLVPPAADQARVRLVQGSPNARKLTVNAVDGPLLARDVEYGTTTGYADVPQGRWTLQVTAPDGSDAMTDAPVVDLAAGSTNSLVVTDDLDGGFAINAIVDAVGLDSGLAPVGGTETGAGGSGPGVVGSSSGAASAGVASLLGVLLLGLPVVARAHARHRRV